MGRSSLRHNREIQGYDSAGETAADHGEKFNNPHPGSGTSTARAAVTSGEAAPAKKATRGRTRRK